MYLLYDLYHYHIKYEWGGRLNCAYSSLMIAYYKFITHEIKSIKEIKLTCIIYITNKKFVSSLQKIKKKKKKKKLIKNSNKTSNHA